MSHGEWVDVADLPHVPGIDLATPTSDGLMAAADKALLDSLVLDTSVGTHITLGGHMLLYDSDWRAIALWSGGAITYGFLSESMEPIDSEGGLYFRRINNIVYCQIRGARMTAASASIDLPAGFRGSAQIPYPAVSVPASDPSGAQTAIWVQVGSGRAILRAPASGYTLPWDNVAYASEFSWATDLPLPTVLPGIPK